MELFAKLFHSLLVLVYHCFDRIVIHGYLSGLSRPEQVVYFVRQVLGIPVVSKETLSQRTDDYRNWVEAFARNHKIPMEWAEKDLRKENHVLPALRRMEKRGAYGVYFIFKSMEQGRTFRISGPKYPTQDPNHLLAQRPLLHRARTPARRHWLSQERQRLPGGGRCCSLTDGGRPIEPSPDPQATGLLDPDCGTEEIGRAHV